jgi:hypothetical protein
MLSNHVKISSMSCHVYFLSCLCPQVHNESVSNVVHKYYSCTQMLHSLHYVANCQLWVVTAYVTQICTGSQEERSIFWEIIVLAIQKKSLYEHVSYSERFPR